MEEAVKSSTTEEFAVRSTWKRKIDFCLNLFGMSIGLGNVWRFPYLCYKNGGGVFLIAYVTLLAIFVVPTIILEVSLGQYTRSTAISVWKLVPVLKGTGYAAYVILIYSNSYYPVIMAWSLRWLVASLSPTLPWTNCQNSWNSNSCIPIYKSSLLNQSDGYSEVNNISLLTSSKIPSSSVEEYWREHILGLSSGLEELGTIRWDLALCLLTIWLLVYFSVWKGIGWTSKVVYITATLPLMMILVVLVRGVTLPGAVKGIHKYLNPDIKKLGDLELWTDAANQVTFSFVIGYGNLISLASHNQFNHNVIWDAVTVSISNALTSFTSGFAIFSIIGHLAEIKNATVDEVAEYGPGLVFMVYPTALSFLPLANVWMVVFFTMLILLGMDSLFVMQDGMYECSKDIAPRLFRGKWSHEIGHIFICGSLFILGLILVTNGGMYVLHILNTYSAAGFCVYALLVSELIGFGWIYGANRILEHLSDMMKMRIPKIWLTVSWMFLAPLIALLLLFYSFASMKPLVYDRTYEYPTWANILAWISAFSSVILIPIMASREIWNSPGVNLMEKVKNSAKSKFVLVNAKTADESPFLQKKEETFGL